MIIIENLILMEGIMADPPAILGVKNTSHFLDLYIAPLLCICMDLTSNCAVFSSKRLILLGRSDLMSL
jgi:hypothetical protein